MTTHIIGHCDGCDDDTPVAPYVVTDHDGVETPVMYCDDCAAYARADWNGETMSIRPGHDNINP